MTVWKSFCVFFSVSTMFWWNSKAVSQLTFVWQFSSRESFSLRLEKFLIQKTIMAAALKLHGLPFQYIWFCHRQKELDQLLNSECEHPSPQGEQLYTVKLYKGRHEFLQLVPSKETPLKTFPLKGVNVQVRICIWKKCTITEKDAIYIQIQTYFKRYKLPILAQKMSDWRSFPPCCTPLFSPPLSALAV